MRKREGNKEQAILKAATDIFAEYGYHGAKIAAIAEAAGVATGSVYLYYENKEAVLLRLFEDLWTNLIKVLKVTVARTDIEPMEKLNIMVDQYFDAFITNPALAKVYVSEQQQLIKEDRGNVAKHYDSFLTLAEEIIREGMQKKIFNPDVDIKLFRHYLTGGIRSLLQLWANQPQAFPLNRIKQNVKYFIQQGLKK